MHFRTASAISLALLTACNLPTDAGDYVQQYVIYGNIAAGAHSPDTLFVSRTSPIGESSEIADRWISDALVTLSGGGSTVTLEAVPGVPGRYLDLSATPMIFQPGVTYALEVTIGGSLLTASATIPDSLSVGSIAMVSACDGVAVTVPPVNLNLGSNGPADFAAAIAGDWSGLAMDTIIYREGPCYSASFVSIPLMVLEWSSDSLEGIIRATTLALDQDPQRAIIDSSFQARAFKGRLQEDEDGNLYRPSPFTWNLSNTEVWLSWLFFNYTGPHLITLELTDHQIADYFAGDPFNQNPLLEPQGNIEGGKGLFYASRKVQFAIWVERESEAAAKGAR